MHKCRHNQQDFPEVLKSLPYSTGAATSYQAILPAQRNHFIQSSCNLVISYIDLGSAPGLPRPETRIVMTTRKAKLDCDLKRIKWVYMAEVEKLRKTHGSLLDLWIKSCKDEMSAVEKVI